MNRLEKKCFIASAGTHGLLFALLFSAPLFLASKPAPEPIHELKMIPSQLIDSASFGGGNPAAAAPAPAPAPARTQPQLAIAPPAPATPPARHEPEKPARQEPEKPARREPEKPPREEAVERPSPRRRPRVTAAPEKTVPDREPEEEESDDPNDVRVGRRRIHVTFNNVPKGRTKPSNAGEDPQAVARANARAAQARYAARVNSIVGAIGQGISSGTSIEVPGPGGEAYVNYREFVVAAYKKAWSPPPDMLKNVEVVRARAVIRRDGTVASFEIVNRSGRAALDDSVDRLKKIRFIAPFPEGARDDERTFYIRFNLQPDQE